MSDLQILVLQRGWVAVGPVSFVGSHVVMREGAIVRRWGTKAGLPQLAEDGPQPETILDPITRPLRAHELTVVLMLECNPKKWEGWLGSAAKEKPKRKR